jgi:hypothetical protein
MPILKAPDNMDGLGVNLAERKLEAGVIGKLFGTGDNAAKNTAGIVILILILGGLIGYFYNKDGGKLFDIVVPIVTLGLGYLFGEKMAELRNGQ